jgi:iron complex outermembrane recepter protein
MKRLKIKARLGSAAKRGFCIAICLLGARAQEPAEDLSKKSLEQLLSMEVTSASKHSEKLANTAAAIFVITQDDIRRSGATSIPEVLRMVPGLEVARVSSNSWAISARGFNNQFSNKLLVLMDGRSVYDPAFSGVFWDAQDTMLEDIERIEVIRGPGGTLWGANAVNGVINIITKPTRDTQGGLLVAGAGSLEKNFGSARYGGKFGAHTTYRMYSKYFERAPLVDARAVQENDGWDAARGGFRVDSRINDRDSLSVQGEVYKGTANGEASTVAFAPPFVRAVSNLGGFGGGDILGKWTREYSRHADVSLQVYYDHTQRNRGIARLRRDTVDFDFQHHFVANDRNEIIWGAGYRFAAADSARALIDPVLVPAGRSQNTPSAFVQDDIQLVRNRLRLTLGTKLEHNSFTGPEVQPTATLLWAPNEKNSLWVSVSRAVRTPSRIEADLQGLVAALAGPGGRLTVVRYTGNPKLKSEDLLAYEFGYRAQTSRRTSFDLATFYNRYSDFVSTELGKPFVEGVPPAIRVVVPESPSNKYYARTFGAELSAAWNPVASWKLSGAYTWLDQALRPTSSSNDVSTSGLYGANPKHQFNLRSSYDFTSKVESDTSVFFVDRIAGTQGQKLASYTEVNTRIAYRVANGMEISLVGQNLLKARHVEFVGGPLVGEANWQRRSIYGKVQWSF